MKIDKILLVILYIALGFLILYLARTSDEVDTRLEESAEAILGIEQISLHDIMIVSGEEIYVPAYSSIKSIEGKGELKLSINLSVRNTDPAHSIVLSFVDFYNSKGKITKKFIDKPVKINPMATMDFHIAQSDTIGGSGANFYLKWVADEPVNEPVVEAIMLGSSGTQGYSWTSPGLVVKHVE